MRRNFLHAELHYRIGEDLDRRIAMIGFDNAIEVAITTYLGLHPVQRASRQYPNADVERWLSNYHTKVGFFFQECVTRQVAVALGIRSLRNTPASAGEPSRGKASGGSRPT